ncbi:MAG: hypothetical protein GWN41_05060 [Phycisphaerae bacterium]|nr:hypothetical protein [Phycisphaerae bacterium]
MDKQWWQPDGSLLVNPPYDESDIDILSFRKPDAIPIEFAFRLSGNLGEPAWEAKVKGEEQAFIWWTGRRSKNGKFLTDIKSIGMFVKSDQRTLNLRLGFSLADGPYEWVDFKNISIKPNFKPDVQVKGEPLDPHADNPRAVISAIIEQLKSAKYVHSGRGSADVVDVQTSSSYQSSSRSEKILEFRFEGNLSRSDAFTSEKGKRGDFECSWAVGPLSSVSYNNAYGSATVQARPFSQFYRQLGYDFHPETFPRMYQNSIVDLLEGMARQPQVTLKVTQEPKDVVRVVSESKNETSEQKLCILLINDADGMRLSSWEFTAKDLTEDGAGARRSSLRLKWKKYAGFWYISEAISEGAGVHDGLRSEGRTTVTIREFTPNVEIEDTEFTLDGLDIPPGAMVNDRILDTRYRYAGSKGYAADKLRKLSQAALMYANDYDNKFPDTIQQFKQFLDEKELKWLSENICYLGKGKTVLDPPETPLAYDRTMYEAEEAKGTNVLFVSGIVSFRTREQFKKLGITSEPKTDLPVEGKGGWGEAVEGVQVRLRADKYRWEAEEKPVFKADICNRGELELYVHAADEFCQLEIDGEWHGWSGPWGKIDDKQSRLGHGSQINDISISLAKTWVGKKSVLALTAGVHTVRAAFILQRSEREYQNVVRVVSNPVEIEVVSAKAKPTMQVEGEVEFKLITKPLTIKGIELQLPKVATLQYWNEVFDLDSETISYYEPGARRWPKGADVGFDIDFPQEIKGSVNWGINTGYKTTGHRFLALDSYSFEQAVLETFTKLDELRNSKWMGFGLSKLTLKKFPEFFAVLTDGYSVKANSTVEHPTPKLAIIEVVEARDKSAKIKYWLERKTQNKAAVEVEGEGLKTEIQEVVKGFWTAVTAEDWQAVNEYSEMDILKQRAGALEHVLAGVGAERKGLLSRGIDISRIDEVYVEGKEAIAIGPANGERYQWYYLQKRGDVWVIKLFDDAPPRMSVQDVFFKCRSVDKLMLMGERLTKYAAEHQGKLPENLEALEPYIPDKSLRAWLRQHVEYLGKAKEMEKTPNSTIAYTKTLVSKDENISALFNDGNVDFVRTSQVERDI